jgi:hypothetical protein
VSLFHVFTHDNQSDGSSTGHRCGSGLASSSARVRRQRLPHRQSSARSTRTCPELVERVGPQGVALHVSRHLQKMGVLNRKGLVDPRKRPPPCPPPEHRGREKKERLGKSRRARRLRRRRRMTSPSRAFPTTSLPPAYTTEKLLRLLGLAWVHDDGHFSLVHPFASGWSCLSIRLAKAPCRRGRRGRLAYCSSG